MENALPHVMIYTELGNIELELEVDKAPGTCANFLRYVDTGLYKDVWFYRTVTLDNQPNDAVKIEVIQGGLGMDRLLNAKSPYPPIPMERTSVTGLSHKDGVLSMARLLPDSACSEFFICINDQPELDFGGKRNPDGNGFAAFGRVVQGMEVVRKIQGLPAEGQSLTPPLKISSVERL